MYEVGEQVTKTHLLYLWNMLEINYFWVLFNTYCRFKKSEFRTFSLRGLGKRKIKNGF